MPFFKNLPAAQTIWPNKGHYSVLGELKKSIWSTLKKRSTKFSHFFFENPPPPIDKFQGPCLVASTYISTVGSNLCEMNRVLNFELDCRFLCIGNFNWTLTVDRGLDLLFRYVNHMTRSPGKKIENTKNFVSYIISVFR